MEGAGLQVSRTRVNYAYMHQNHGSQVCLLGIVNKGDVGQAFQVKTSDGGLVNVRMKTPLTEPVSGLIEVCGIGQGKNLVLGESYVTFPEEIEKTFDLGSYNELVSLLNTIDSNQNPWKLA